MFVFGIDIPLVELLLIVLGIDLVITFLMAIRLKSISNVEEQVKNIAKILMGLEEKELKSLKSIKKHKTLKKNPFNPSK